MKDFIAHHLRNDPFAGTGHRQLCGGTRRRSEDSEEHLASWAEDVKKYSLKGYCGRGDHHRERLAASG